MTGFTWARTAPDSPYDFMARDAEGFLVDRIYRQRGGLQDGKWLWRANGIQAAPGTVGCDLNGVAGTRDEEIKRLHIAWTRWMEMGGAVDRVL